MLFSASRILFYSVAESKQYVINTGAGRVSVANDAMLVNQTQFRLIELCWIEGVENSVVARLHLRPSDLDHRPVRQFKQYDRATRSN